MAGNFFADLPAYQIPNNAMVNFSGLNQAIGNIGETRRQNAMLEYRMQQDAKANARADAAAGRAQQEFDMKKGELALNKLAGVVQSINTAPPDQQEALWQRFQPMYADLRSKIPGFDKDAADMGVDANDHVAVGRLIGGLAGGYKDPLEVQKTQAEINRTNAQAKFYEQKPAMAGGAKDLVARKLMDENPNLTYAEAYTIASRGEGVTAVGDTLVDRNTGKEVRNVAPAISGKSEAEAAGKAKVEFQTALPKLKMGYDAYNQRTDRLLAAIDKADKMVGSSTAGYGAVLAGLPEGDARILKNTLDTIRGNVGFGELQAMREASPTGGALGQVSDFENKLLQSLQGALDQYDKGENLKQNLAIIRKTATQLRDLKRQQYNQTLEQAKNGPAAAVQNAQPIPAAPDSDPLSQARDAIARGASRDAVIERLRANGIDPGGL